MTRTRPTASAASHTQGSHVPNTQNTHTQQPSTHPVEVARLAGPVPVVPPVRLVAQLHLVPLPHHALVAPQPLAPLRRDERLFLGVVCG